MDFPNRQQFLESCLPQVFSLPIPIMKYIWENHSSPEVYQKLIKSCKLLFLKNPILVIKCLEYFPIGGWKYCNSNHCGGNQRHGHEPIDMEKLNVKLWVAKKLDVRPSTLTNIASYVIPKMYRNDIKILTLRNQILSFDELKFLAAGIEECSLSHNTVMYGNGVQVPMDEVIKLFSGAKSVLLFLAYDPFNAAAPTRYTKFFDACFTVEKVFLRCIPNDFDVREFYQQIKRCKNHACITIHSWSNRNHYDEIIDEIRATETFDFVPPVIEYGGRTNLMKEIQAREAAKYH